MTFRVMTSQLTAMFLRMATLLWAVVMFVREGSAQTVETVETMSPSTVPAQDPVASSVRYLSQDERAALWACFLGGLFAIVGFGFLYWEYKLKKYENPYPYKQKKSKKPRTVEENPL